MMKCEICQQVIQFLLYCTLLAEAANKAQQQQRGRSSTHTPRSAAPLCCALLLLVKYQAILFHVVVLYDTIEGNSTVSHIWYCMPVIYAHCIQ